MHLHLFSQGCHWVLSSLRDVWGLLMKLRLGFKSRSDIGTGSAICSIWLCRRAIRKSWRKGLTFCCWCGGFRWSESDASQWRGILFPVNPSSLWRQHQTRGGTPLGSVVLISMIWDPCFELNCYGNIYVREWSISSLIWYPNPGYFSTDQFL